MRITFYAHASFRLEGEGPGEGGLVVVTDPYTPGPKPGSGFDPVNEPADLVIMSSSTDTFHSDPSHIGGEPVVVDALELPAEGDTGDPVPPEHLERLAGKVDVLLALAGAHATIALDDLDAAIQAIRPRAIIPMHYRHSRGWLDIEPVDTFLSRYPAEMVTRVGGPSIEFTKGTLPAEAHIFVLEQTK